MCLSQDLSNTAELFFIHKYYIVTRIADFRKFQLGKWVSFYGVLHQIHKVKVTFVFTFIKRDIQFFYSLYFSICIVSGYFQGTPVAVSPAGIPGRFILGRMKW